MFFAAFRSRSWTVPHLAQAHRRTFSGLLPLLTPHAEHGPVDGTNRPIFPKCRPYRSALYSSMATNADQPASWTDLASRVRASPATHRSSAYTAWLSRISAVESFDAVTGNFVIPAMVLTNALCRAWETRAVKVGTQLSVSYRRFTTSVIRQVTSLTGWPVTWAMAVKSRSSHSNVSLSRSAVAAISRSTGPAERCIAASVSDC